MFVSAVGSMLLFVLYLAFTTQVSTLAVQFDLLAVTRARLNASVAPEISEGTQDDENHINDSPLGRSNDTSPLPIVTDTDDQSVQSKPTLDIQQRGPVPGIANTTNIYETYAIYTSKCRIRDYDYKNKTVLQKFFKSDGKQCSPRAKPFVFFPDLNTTGGYSCIGFDANASMKHFNAEENDWNCTYKEVIRNTKYQVIDKHYDWGRTAEFVPGDCPDAEYLWIECYVEKLRMSYSQPLMMPLVKPVEKQVRDNNLKKKPLNVLVVGMDSVSRLNAYRQFPKTLDFLRKKENLVELFGYNKIGVNSAPNQIPLLSGVKYLGDNLKARVTNKFFDNQTRYLWDDFDSRGYRTMYYEEQWSYGLFVYPSTNGFKKVSPIAQNFRISEYSPLQDHRMPKRRTEFQR